MRKNNIITLGSVAILVIWVQLAGGIFFQLNDLDVKTSGKTTELLFSLKQGVGKMRVECGWVYTPPPGSGLPDGQYLEVYIENAEFSETFPALLERVRPPEGSCIKLITISQVPDSKLLIYILCEPGTQAAYTLQHTEITVHLTAKDEGS